MSLRVQGSDFFPIFQDLESPRKPDKALKVSEFNSKFLKVFEFCSVLESLMRCEDYFYMMPELPNITW